MSKNIYITIDGTEIRIDDIHDMLDGITLLPEYVDSNCLEDSLSSYVSAIHEFFDGNLSVENVKQAYCRERGCEYCIRCDNKLTADTYEYRNQETEYICNKCLGNEVK